MKIYIVVGKNKEIVQAFSSLSKANKFVQEIQIEATCFVCLLDGFFNEDENDRRHEGRD